MTGTGLSPAQLCSALALRLAAVVPDGLEVEASGSDLVIRVPTAPLLGMTQPLGSLLAPYKEGGLLESGRILHGCLSVLDDIQEVAVRFLGRAWPSELDGLQAPGARIERDSLLLWFGREGDPALALQPIRLA